MIKGVEKNDQPREKLLKYGPERLKDEELLSLLLHTGSEGKSVIVLAREVLKACKEVKLQNISVREIRKIKGIGFAKACEIVACFELGRRMLQEKQSAILLSPEGVWESLQDIRDSKKEHFVIFFLDTQNQVTRREVVSVGILNASLVHPREVFEPAIKYLAAHIILAHNHPSGNLEPSPEDKIITQRLVEAGRLLGIEIVDHVIVTSKSFFSFKANKFL